MPSFKYLYLKSDSPSYVHGKGMEAKFIMAQKPSGVVDWNVFHLTIYIRPGIKPTTCGKCVFLDLSSRTLILTITVPGR